MNLSCLLRPDVLLLTAALVAPGMASAQNGLQWATFLGGSGQEAASQRNCSLAPGGDIVVSGFTESTNFPCWNAWQSTYGGPTPASNGFGDGCVTRLRADGSCLWSTYLGGSDEDAILGVVADAAGGVTVCGMTKSTNFPTTTGAFQTTPQGYADAFVARFVWDGLQLHLLWSTRLGGRLDDTATSLAVHPSGLVVVTGATQSPDFPIRGTPFQNTLAGGYDGFVAVLDATGSILQNSTYLGGSSHDAAWTPTWAPPWVVLAFGSEIALDPAGNPVIVGATRSANFPTTPDAFQPNPGGNLDGMVVRMDLALSRLTYSSYLGGSGLDLLGGLVITGDDRIVISGETNSTNYPVSANAFQPNLNPTTTCPYADGIVTVLDSRATGNAQLVYSSYFGGTGCDNMHGLAVDRQGMILLGGLTEASDLPVTAGTYQPVRSGNWDAWLAQLDPGQVPRSQPRYVTYLGGSCPDGDYTYDILLDELGNAILFGGTQCSTFPATSGSFQPVYGGNSDMFVAKLNLLPRGVERFGHPTPACLGPIHQTVDSWPVANNATFTLEVINAPPNAAGLIAFALPAPTCWPIAGIDCFLGGPILAAPPQVANSAGNACYALPIPAGVPGSPPYGLATQWFFLTTPQCPGTGLVASSEGLRF